MQITDAVRALERDLRDLFGSRLQSIVAYSSADGAGALTSTLAVVDGVTVDDLRACAARVASWHDAGLDTPLVVAQHEFGRSLDVFPLEFGSILANHVVVVGRDPFAGLNVEPADFRRACEVQARSHLLHLREAYMEAEGRGDRVAELIRRSSAPLAALLASVARLDGLASDDALRAARHVEAALHLDPGSFTDVVKLPPSANLSSDAARQLFPRYLDGVERLTGYIDQWKGR